MNPINSRPIRIGLMSFAHVHTDTYLTRLRELSGVEVIGIADDDTKRGQQAAAQYAARYFDSYDALLKEAPDGVVICSENSLHRELVETALAAGIKHICCEKPLATTLDDAKAIVKAAEQVDAHLMTAFPVRFSPPIREAKAMIDANKLGKIVGVNATNQGENPGRHRSWFVDKRLAGGGAVMDHTVHVVDVLRWIFKSEISEIYAEVGNLFPSPGTNVDTAGVLMITFQNGTFVGLDCSWSRPPYYPTWGNVKLDFVGERGLVTVDTFSQHYIRYSHSVQRPLWDFWGSDIDLALMEEFVASIRENRDPMVTGYDGMKAVEAVIAAYLSGESHEPVKLPLI